MMLNPEAKAGEIAIRTPDNRVTTETYRVSVDELVRALDIPVIPGTRTVHYDITIENRTVVITVTTKGGRG
jgi:hypothetical protein